MGKGISLAELNRMHRSKNPVHPPRQRPNIKRNYNAQFKSELRQKSNQFPLHRVEREHFRPREQKQEPLQARLLLFFIGILGICIFSFLLLFILLLTWEIFLLNIGNFYFWGYVFLVLLLFFHHDANWKIVGLIVLIIGWYYWLSISSF